MLVNLEKILLGLGALAVIALGVLITSNVIARALFASQVPDSVTMVRELMVAAILLPLAAATAARDGAPEAQTFTTGILPRQAMRVLLATGEIEAEQPVSDDQIQPASLDLRLGATAYRVRGSFLPGQKSTVRSRLDNFTMHQVDLTDGAVLEKGCVYVVPLLESLSLKKEVSGMANPKSSTGRLDIADKLEET